jgi:ATP-binding cassette, subfamily B (MDR/TAP), member 1
MTRDLQTKWYQALLRQDMAYFDIMDVSGTATIIGTNAAKYNRGVGNKLGLAIQFIVTFLGGICYSFYASWQTSLVTLLTLPFMAVSGWFLVTMNASQSQRANSSYQKAGSIVYTTVTSIRTILSLNGAQAMIQQFQDGTTQNHQQATRQVHLLGLASGCMMSSFLLSSIVIPLYGGYLLYSQVLDTGCDPSGAVPGVDTCDPAGADVFGAMFGIFIAASVLPQISTTAQSFLEARVACYRALQVMGRTLESNEPPQEENNHKKEPLRRQTDAQAVSLPKYTIDSSSPDGFKPTSVRGAIQFQNVTFGYPTRSETNVLNRFSLEIQPGTTLALVGTSGSGKSTVAQLLERFYDPSEGSILLDGTDLRHLNVSWLREQIGLVSQEPSLFACSIRENIAYGCSNVTAATMEQIEAAAKAAQCYDFIQEFPNGFETQVGDKGTFMSGGQKQRIAIARCLIKNPKILIFDEATSALDSENERMVQTAIDQLLETKGCTSIIIAVSNCISFLIASCTSMLRLSCTYSAAHHFSASIEYDSQRRYHCRDEGGTVGRNWIARAADGKEGRILWPGPGTIYAPYQIESKFDPRRNSIACFPTLRDFLSGG